MCFSQDASNDMRELDMHMDTALDFSITESRENNTACGVTPVPVSALRVPQQWPGSQLLRSWSRCEFGRLIAHVRKDMG